MSSRVKNNEPEIKPDDQIQIEADPELENAPETEAPEAEGGEAVAETADDPEPEKDTPKIAGAELIGGVDLAALESGSILLFQPRIPMSDAQFKQLQKHVAGEEARTGCKIILVPYSCKVGE